MDGTPCAEAASEIDPDRGTHLGVLVPDVAVNPLTWSLAGYGRTIGDGSPVGLAEGIARWLLEGRSATAVGPDDDVRNFSGLLVMGDGSASRTDKAPGHLHPQAQAFDANVVKALRDGTPDSLSALDMSLAHAVLAAGAAAWQALGRAVDTVTDAQVDAVADPFGVLYVVARWSVRWADRA